MKKRVFLNCLSFLLIFLVSAGQAGQILCASAPSGSHVYRASVGPRPKYQPAPAQQKAEPVRDEAAAAPEEPADVQGAVASEAEKPAAPAMKKAAKSTPQSGKAVASAPVPKAPVAKESVKSPKAGPGAEAGKARKGEPPATAKDLFLNVQAAFLINMSTGQVYYEHNPDKAIQPASITKLLTLYLVREAMAQGRLSPSTPIPVSATAVRTGGSRMRLKRGEKVPLNELIKGISVVSANNACVAVAEYMGNGDPAKFVSQMNAKAKTIGMANSRFKNPNGLPDRAQLSTARDIAKLSMNYLRTFPEALKVHSLTSHTYHGSTHRNANTLLKTYKGVDGLKTGFVCEAGYNITATAKRGDTRLLAVVLGAQNSSVRRRETAKLLDYGFMRAAKENGLGNRAEAAPKKPKA